MVFHRVANPEIRHVLTSTSYTSSATFSEVLIFYTVIAETGDLDCLYRRVLVRRKPKTLGARYSTSDIQATRSRSRSQASVTHKPNVRFAFTVSAEMFLKDVRSGGTTKSKQDVHWLSNSSAHYKCPSWSEARAENSSSTEDCGLS